MKEISGRGAGSAPAGTWSRVLGGADSGVARAARVALRDVLQVKEKERVLIVTNPQSDVLKISWALADVAVKLGADASLVIQPRRTALDMASDSVIHAIRSEPEIVISISAAKLGKDRFGLQKPYRFKGHKGSWPHIFDALRGAKRSRAFWSPSITLDSFVRTVPVDYRLMRRRASKLRTSLDAADRIHITAGGGTDLEVGVRGRRAFADDGSFSQPGSGGNLPAGETYISPALYDADGLMVFDGTVALVGGAFVPRRPVAVEVRKGRAVRVSGGREAARLEESLRAGEKMALEMTGKKGWTPRRVASYERNARHLGEIGIGLNPKARITGNMLEDEKVRGTCHVAIGSNYDNDAQALIHLDCLIRSPTITAVSKTGERRVILRGGRMV